MNINWLSIAIAILYIYNFVFDSISFIKDGKSANDKKKENNTQKSRKNIRLSDFIVFAISVLLLLSVYIFFIWADVFPKRIVLPLITVFTVVFHINNLFKASESVKSVVLGSDSNHNLSIREKYNFDIISGVFLLFYSIFISGKVERYILDLDLSRNITGVFLTSYSAIVMFGLSFSIIIQLLLPIKHLQKISVYISNKTKNTIKIVTRKLYYMHDEGTIVKASFTNSVLDSTSNSKILIKVMVCVFILPCVFTIDVIVGFFLCLFWYGICGVLIIVYEFLGFIGKGFFYIVSIVTKNPERKIIKNAFRLSFILSVMFVVVINRYGWIYEYDEVFLAVSEFLASTIIIPVIFEWIYSNEKDKTDKQSQIKVPPQANCLKNSQKKNNKKKPNHTPWRKSKKK